MLCLFGDINTDGLINNQDSTLLSKYIAGYYVEISEETADVDADGYHTRRDAMILARYLAGWEGYSLTYTK